MSDRTAALQLLREHHAQLNGCALCPLMLGPVVAPPPVASRVLLLGQAPGPHEGRLGRPFAWTAGRTLFGWFEALGVDEDLFRSRIYMAAVCRCFPGKSRGGGDRVPSRVEIESCSRWLRRELEILRPELLIPVGGLAIRQVTEYRRLTDVVGRTLQVELHGHRLDAVPLPHPSGASTWHRTEPGRTLLATALEVLGAHPAFVAATGCR